MSQDVEGHRVDPVTMRRMNAVRILRVLHAGGSMTLTELMNATGLARRTTTVAVESLVARGFATDDDPPDAVRAVGRPARHFSFRRSAGYVAGIGVGVREVHAMVADIQGRELSESHKAVARSADRRERAASVVEAVDECLVQIEMSRSDLWNTVVATPGLVVDSRHVTLCEVLPDWSNLDLSDLLGRELGCPVRVVNDINSAAVAERWRGSARGVDDMVWVLTGRHSRAALVIGGELVLGADGAAGEIGWITELGWKELAEHPLSRADAPRGEVGSKVMDVLDGLQTGESSALDAVDDYAHTLAPGLSALCLVVNPRLMVLGGVAPRIGEPLLRAIEKQVTVKTLRVPEFRLSGLGDEAVPLGAVRLALDLAEARLFSLDGVL